MVCRSNRVRSVPEWHKDHHIMSNGHMPAWDRIPSSSPQIVITRGGCHWILKNKTHMSAIVFCYPEIIHTKLVPVDVDVATLQTTYKITVFNKTTSRNYFSRYNIELGYNDFSENFFIGFFLDLVDLGEFALKLIWPRPYPTSVQLQYKDIPQSSIPNLCISLSQNCGIYSIYP